jgi:MFS family permease
MNGASGKSGWEWLFIIEGAIAIFVGILVCILLPRFPDKIRTEKHWLFTEDDISLAIRRYKSKFESIRLFRVAKG